MSQRDSATSQGERMCFSSSCAMAAAFLKPTTLAGAAQPDDQYLQIVQRYGDSTSAPAQLQALRRLGIAARFRSDGSIQLLISRLMRGIPCPVGWLHHGPVSAPRGGGHWSLVVGFDPASSQWLMHDPYGEADLVAGGFCKRSVGSGRSVRYSSKNWGSRWMVEGPSSGWWLDLS
ncbi:hypothetical protein [Cyanobium sp. WAJ14-Wanaka]|uniref:hypothetical protein n=1 Tax=Cyanobium sp. WAJ14-Wanaka TaxID=2823725 RepID=UPI0020CFE801|nr:hypothetical protein [Cyanobium sp. WAJ14-Wanaka]MCP9774292.1 hypothetical protein [Cyanobium sp. WAJ14-Wanaka]